MAELYWMALLRDELFSRYLDPASQAVQAANSLQTEFTDYTGPLSGGIVTPDVLFRGNLPGDLNGPYVSQFLLHGTEDNGRSRRDGYIGYGAQEINQRLFTADSNQDFLITDSEWLDSQRGLQPIRPIQPDPTPRFIRNLRDLAIYVRADRTYQAYYNAALILMNIRHLAPSVPDRNPVDPMTGVDGTDPNNPYHNNPTQEGFVTFGDWHVLPLLAEVTTRALKAAWYQKFFVHRRLRPEEFGGRVHFHRSGAANYPINAELLASSVLPLIEAAFRADLLPQAFPEGSPLHPSYPSGHAVVAGACVTILKAWFDENVIIPAAQVFEADPATNGTTLRAVAGATDLRVGEELNKLASNISIARNGAGVHYRSDYYQGVLLGEKIAIGLLEDQRNNYNELFNGFNLTRFDGTAVIV